MCSSDLNRADPVFLTHAAEDSGGRFIDLVGDNVADADTKLLSATTRVTAVSADAAREVILRSPYPRDGRIEVAGQLTEATTRVRLTVAHPAARPFDIDVAVRTNAAPFALVAPTWARLKIDALEAQYEFNRAEIRRLRQAFKLVTRETSLIVLERVEDYARYEIAPPAELAADYERLRTTLAQRATTDRTAHLNNIVRRFEAKIAWWNRDFPKGDKQVPHLKPAESNSGAVGSVLQERQSLSENRPPAPASAPMRADALTAQRLNEQGAKVAGVRAKDEAVGGGSTVATIQLKKWEPDAPYATRMRNAAADDVYRIYLDEKPGYLNSTAFFLDAADILFDRKQPQDRKSTRLNSSH